MTNPSEFGHWANTDERLEELRDRLAAWWLGSEASERSAQLSEIWDEAGSRFATKLAAMEDPLAVNPNDILRAFGEVLDDYDNIHQTFREGR